MLLRPLLLLLLPLPLLLGGCLMSAAKTIITAPIKAGEIIYDTATESQEEADIKRGRAARKADEQAERDARAAQKAAKRAARERRRAAEDDPR
ncbi:hypothetical protein [Sandarakinorhabdus limnophila]|uniref:hypothetical protein n=1 Tax=Sandarakinorhabdus limnophila TaxID=210512 RepID=UPI0026F3275C|nr:hypothetical protein [Sandarakinorhabdus limnophila]MCM0033866.1 hypothetical protein [Sandarakinorhabdus limnophila]